MITALYNKSIYPIKRPKCSHGIPITVSIAQNHGASGNTPDLANAKVNMRWRREFESSAAGLDR